MASAVRLGNSRPDRTFRKAQADAGSATKSKNGPDGMDFTLDEVLDLGGTKEDFTMLTSLDDKSKEINSSEKHAVDLNDAELKAFVGKLGIHKYSEVASLLPDGENVTADCVGEKVVVRMKEKSKKVRKGQKEKLPKSKKEEQKRPHTVSNKKLHLPCEKSSKVYQPTLKTGATVDNLTFQKRSFLLVKPCGKWYEIDYVDEVASEMQGEQTVESCAKLAEKLFENELNVFQTRKEHQRGSNAPWIKTVASSGTLADRMAAATILIQDAPLHNLPSLESLITHLRHKGGRRQCLMAMDTLKELLLSDLLPDSRKLWPFTARPLVGLDHLSSGNKDARDRRLLLWLFEDRLRRVVLEVVQALQLLSQDTVSETKNKAMAAAYELLCSKPEQEKAFLALLVNKLGDPDVKLATKASYLLQLLLSKHPNMKQVVVLEVERLLCRPSVSTKAQYYAACFLNQIVFSPEDDVLATKLIGLYFASFNTFVKRGEVDSRMLSALLTGVNRAFPYAKLVDGSLDVELDVIFRIVHVSSFNTNVQALMLLFQIMDSQLAMSDRFYTALYKKILDPQLSSYSKPALFLNLLYKSMKADMVARRVKAFVKRLLQVACVQQPPFTCGSLYLISEILQHRPGICAMMDFFEDSEDEHFEDAPEEEGNSSSQGEQQKEDQNGDEGVPLAEESLDSSAKPVSSWIHQANVKGAKSKGVYNPLNRNPLYCSAENTCLWELRKLAMHFHPTVALFADTILRGDFVQYTGDPLQDFTIMRFLDRFVYRNPKQPKPQETMSSMVMRRKQKTIMNDFRNIPVNSKRFLQHDESKIPAHDVFFHSASMDHMANKASHFLLWNWYFKIKEKEQTARPRHEADDDSIEDVSDDEFEIFLDECEEGVEDDDLQDDLDFAGSVKRPSKRNKREDNDDEDEDEDEECDLDDEEVSLGSMDDDVENDVEDAGGVFMEEEEEDSLDDTAQGVERSTKIVYGKRAAGGRMLHGQKTKRQKRNGAGHNVLLAAEEFGEILDENIGMKLDTVGLNAMANRDKASIKQLRWEVDRDRWIRGRGRGRGSFRRRRPEKGLVGSFGGKARGALVGGSCRVSGPKQSGRGSRMAHWGRHK
uniref:CCAAT/enhancer-binding protein zeta isoform X2 n=1 Tax=Myxine glutinosa TaxID=7769 RepID=UPI00358E36B5